MLGIERGVAVGAVLDSLWRSAPLTDVACVNLGYCILGYCIGGSTSEYGYPKALCDDCICGDCIGNVVRNNGAAFGWAVAIGFGTALNRLFLRQCW